MDNAWLPTSRGYSLVMLAKSGKVKRYRQARNPAPPPYSRRPRKKSEAA